METVLEGWREGEKKGKKAREGEREKREGEREREAAQFMPLSPRSEDSSLGGTQTLSPCPALYSPGNCSQINLAGYPVELSPVQPSVAPRAPGAPRAPRALYTGCSFRSNGGWWRTNSSMHQRWWKSRAQEEALMQPCSTTSVCVCLNQ